MSEENVSTAFQNLAERFPSLGKKAAGFRLETEKGGLEQMVRSIKLMSVKMALLAATAVFSAAVGNAGAQAVTDADMAAVRKNLEKAGVQDVAKINYLPPQAVDLFKAAGQEVKVDTEAIKKALEGIRQQNPADGNNPPNIPNRPF